MTKTEILKRKYKLNRQAARLIEAERIDLQERFILIRMLEREESKIDGHFDQVCSHRIDLIKSLLGE